MIKIRLTYANKDNNNKSVFQKGVFGARACLTYNPPGKADTTLNSRSRRVSIQYQKSKICSIV